MIFWLAIAGLLLVSFLFSGIEAGILSLNRIRLRHRVKHRDPDALRASARRSRSPMVSAGSSPTASFSVRPAPCQSTGCSPAAAAAMATHAVSAA